MARSKGKEKFQFKKFMLYNGQWVAVSIAGFFLVLLGGMGLYKVLSSKSPATNARELTRKAEDLRRMLQTQDLPPTDTFEIPAVTGAPELVSLEEYRTSTPYFYPVVIDEKKRRNPGILVPEEAKVHVVHAQIRGFMLSQDGDSIWILKETPPPGPGMGPAGPGPGLPPAAGTGHPAGVPHQPGSPGQPNVPAGKQPAAPPIVTKELVALDAASLGEAKGKFAETIVPMRLVVISGSFPLKKQLEEYQNKLRFKDMHTFLNDQSVLPTFRGFKVERRTLDAYGQPRTDWEERNLDMTYARLVNKSELGAQTREKIKNFGLLRFQPDDPKWQPLLPEGLIMPLPLQFPPPHVPEPAPPAGKTPGDKGKPKQVVVSSKVQAPLPYVGRRKQPESFDIFNHDGNMTQTPTTSSQPHPEILEGRPYPGIAELSRVQESLAKLEQQAQAAEAKGPTKPAGSQPKQQHVPDHVLLRIVDGFVEPGFYEYRIRILAENPNFNRTDLVAWAELATEQVLQSDWWVVPGVVVVPPDLSYYVLESVVGNDQQRGPMFQLHRWVEEVMIPGGEKVQVGDWLIFPLQVPNNQDKFVVPPVAINRGEFITRTHPVYVPVWKTELRRFLLARTPDAPNNFFVPVPFGGVGPEPILVDFEGVEPQVHIRNGPDGPVTIQGDSSVEVLILSPDGKKLLARDSATDKATLEQQHSERQQQIESYVTRIKEAMQP